MAVVSLPSHGLHQAVARVRHCPVRSPRPTEGTCQVSPATAPLTEAAYMEWKGVGLVEYTHRHLLIMNGMEVITTTMDIIIEARRRRGI